jgi:hypothetical protein
MMVCDLCTRMKPCLPKEIEGKQYEICHECWDAFALKLLGKGRTKKEREIVFLPPVTIAPEPIELKPTPGQPPKIWS